MINILFQSNSSQYHRNRNYIALKNNQLIKSELFHKKCIFKLLSNLNKSKLDDLKKTKLYLS